MLFRYISSVRAIEIADADILKTDDSNSRNSYVVLRLKIRSKRAIYRTLDNISNRPDFPLYRYSPDKAVLELRVPDAFG